MAIFRSKKFLLFFYLFFFSCSINAQDVIVGNALERNYIDRAFRILNSQDIDVSSLWIYSNLNVRSGRSSDVIGFLKKNIEVIISDDLMICADSPGKEIKPCISNSEMINYLTPYFSVVRSKDLSKFGDNGRLILSLKNGKNKFLPENSKAVLIFSNNNQLGLSSEGISFFVASQLFGLASSLKEDNFEENYRVCTLGLFRFVCQNREVGFYSVVSMFIVNWMSNCGECTDKDRLILKFIACKYLLSVLSEGEVFDTGLKLLSNNRDLFESAGLNVNSIDHIYRFRLITK